ncbi:FxsA family protein [Candidatus Nanohalovita haloferacivicina]|uniref:FxsA family protein n=1 Tax=Candidatus Nanohalovita haloferacivicina TaxID=2978046 RepID=UPI00325FC059|nr:Protein affecting phage T7 exclusion by the F plasmid [Candidatus Nanohalobia archaeon BNXNv]
MIGILLLLAMIVLPFTDLYILVQLAGMLGFWQTLAIVVVTGIVGATIVKREGRHVLKKLQRSVTAGEISRNVAEGALLVIAGLLLISPGIITDAIGFLLAFRPLRERLVARYIKGNTGNIEIEFYSL